MFDSPVYIVSDAEADLPGTSRSMLWTCGVYIQILHLSASGCHMAHAKPLGNKLISYFGDPRRRRTSNMLDVLDCNCTGITFGVMYAHQAR